MADDRECCGNCRFSAPWDIELEVSYDGKPEIACRRYAPGRIPGGFPGLRASVWCGEYERGDEVHGG